MSSKATPAGAAPNITYATLKEEFGKYLTEVDKTSQIRNHNTTIKTWREALGLSETSFVSGELNGDFEIRLQYYQLTQERAGIKPSTYFSRLSHLRAVANFYRSRFISNIVPLTFHMVLSNAIKDANYKSIANFYRSCASDLCNRTTVFEWCNGRRIPALKSLSAIEEIERRLKLEPGTLTTLLPRNLRGWGRKRKAGATSIGRKIQNSKKKAYYFWSPTLEHEWEDFLGFMTAPYLPEGKKRNSAWTSSEGREGRYFPTGDKTKSHLKAFLGFCCLPESADPFLNGLGMKPEQMTIALLTDKRLTEAYLGFQKVRAGGIYTQGTLSFIILVAQLLRPGTGYLYQHAKLAGKINRRMSEAKWQQICVETRERLLNIGTQLERQGFIVKGRDPEEPIKEILAQDRPLYALLQMVRDMRRDLLSMSKLSMARQALHYRNILLVGLMASNPLRVRHFLIMQFDRHLKQVGDGEWWLEFKREEFKNRHALKCDYSVRVERHLWPIIERYRREFRPFLAGADKCNYVFRPDPRVGAARGVRPLDEGTLFILVQRLTYAYLPNTPGFGPHAFRHIVATDIIKRNPEFGYFLASKALHDKLETVEEAYAHLKTHEYFEPVNRHFASAWEDIIGE